MMEITLPELILLAAYGGDYHLFIESVYATFEKDFILYKPSFRGKSLRLKYHPAFQGKAYTFYHMTHIGNNENDRIPDLRRCERIPFARPVIEKCDNWELKIWPQKRGNKNRLCIWLERQDEPDYFVILDVRDKYILPWTAFVAEYEHQKKKKLKEYQEFIKKQKPPARDSPTVS